MPNNTVPYRALQFPHPARDYQTNGVPEAALQSFGPLAFVMPDANGQYIEYDGTTDVQANDIRFSPEGPHNWPNYVEGRNLLEVLEKDPTREIEITVFKAGVLLTAADLKVGSTFGVTRYAPNASVSIGGTATNVNKNDKAIWTLDPTKTAAAVALCRITAVNLRGFTATGAVDGFNTGGVGDYAARVLVRMVRPN